LWAGVDGEAGLAVRRDDTSASDFKPLDVAKSQRLALADAILKPFVR